VTAQGHKLGEVLRAAREARGVDIVRVERETKIRARYLQALEGGEYGELPGPVYTKGFLRNYGAYLGLDAEYLIDLYRLESAEAVVERPSPPQTPRPLARRRARTFVLTPSVIVAALLTVGVGAFVAYIAWELITFARTPELRITQPAGDVSAHTELTYTLRGQTAPRAEIRVSGGRENPTVRADAEGRFSVTVELVPGSNVITLTAHDFEVGRDSAPQRRTINVVADAAASPTPGIEVSLEQPPPDANLPAPLPIVGSASPGARVEIAASLVQAAAPSFRVDDEAGQPVTLSPPAPTAPAPLRLMAGDDGSFSGELVAPPGTWELRVMVETPGTEPLTRRVTIQPPAGLVGTLRVEGAQSYLEVDLDGEPVNGVSGGISDAGESVTLRAGREVRIRAGNAAAVRLTINGVEIGAMGPSGAVIEWRITRAGG
jgi:cytoskeletal protein RodZ